MSNYLRGLKSNIVLSSLSKMLQNQNSGWALLYLLRYFTLQVPKRMPKYISHRVRPLYFCEKYVLMIYRIIIMIKKTSPNKGAYYYYYKITLKRLYKGSTNLTEFDRQKTSIFNYVIHITFLLRININSEYESKTS